MNNDMAKDKALVVFSRNKDRKTANMFVDNFLINEDIPFIPSKAMDHRGLTLFYYAKENNLNLEDFELDEKTEQASEVYRGFKYMDNPVHVRQEIKALLAAPFRRVMAGRN